MDLKAQLGKEIIMGMTHYWRRGTELPAEAFALAVEDCRKVITYIDVPLGGFEGKGEPIFRADQIMFNGAEGGGCEPFEIHQTEFDRRGRDVFWSSCKTEFAPYDICVKAAVIVLKHHLGNAIQIGSDAKGEKDWDDARMKCQEVFGYGDDFRLDPPEDV